MSTQVIVVRGEEVVVPANVSEERLQSIVSQVKLDQDKKATQKPRPEVLAVPPAATSVAPPAPKGPPKTDNTTFFTNALKEGLPEGLGTLGGAVRALGGAVVDAVTPKKEGTIWDGMKRRFNEVADGGKTLGTEVFGVKEYTPADNTQKMLGAAGKAVTDPTTLASMGLAGFGKAAVQQGAVGMSKVAPMVSQAFGNLFAGGGAEFSRQQVEAVGGGEVLQVGASLLGGGLTQAGASKLGRKSTEAIVDRFPALKKYAGMTAEAVKPSSGPINQRLAQAAAAYKVRTGEDLSKVMGDSFTYQKELGMQKPALSAVDSPELQQVVNEAAGTDPALRAELQNRVDEARTLASKSIDDNLGTVETNQDVIVRQIPNAVAAEPLIKETMQRIKTDVDEKVAAFGKSRGDLDSIEVGEKAEKVLKAQRNAAESITNPLYSNAVKGAAERGEVVPSSYIAKEVLPILDQYGLENAFQKAPMFKEALAKLRFSAQSGSYDSLTNTQKEGLGFSVNQLDSLKREVNDRLSTLGPDDRAMKRPLLELKDAIFGTKNPEGIREGGMVAQVSPQFSKEFREADATYRELVGERFGTDTIKKINAKEFEEGITGMLTLPGSPSRVQEFLKAAGDADGIPLAEAALLSKIGRKGVDGEINQSTLDAWANKYATHLEFLPALKESTKDIRTFVTKQNQSLVDTAKNLRAMTMDEIRRDLDGETNVLMKDVLARRSNGNAVSKYNSPEDLVKGVTGSRQEAIDVIRQYKDNPKFIDAIMATVISNARDTPNPLTALAKLKKENAALAPYIEKNLRDNGKALALLERIDNIKPIGNPMDSVPKDALQAKFGISGRDIQQSAAERLSSVTNKAARLFRKGQDVKQKQADVRTKQAMVKEPEDMLALIKAAETTLSPKASDLEKYKAYGWIVSQKRLAEDLLSDNPEVVAQAKERMGKGLTSVAKEQLLKIPREVNKEGSAVGRITVGQQAREDLTSTEDQDSKFKADMEAILNDSKNP